MERAADVFAPGGQEAEYLKKQEKLNKTSKNQYSFFAFCRGLSFLPRL